MGQLSRLGQINLDDEIYMSILELSVTRLSWKTGLGTLSIYCERWRT